MNAKQIASYGSWKSPISTDLITAKTISLMELMVDGNDIYWIESHPLENGRCTIMRCTPDAKTMECIPSDFYARNTVHEYGGMAFTVSAGNIYFCNYNDQRIYLQKPGALPQAVTLNEGSRFADLVMDAKRNRLVCLREDHTGEGEAVNTIVSVDLNDKNNGDILVEGNNFYSSPRLSPDGTQLAYLTWNHPNMPWDGCELWVATLNEDGTVHHVDLIAGSATESVSQPEWSPDGVLHFVAETSGWWNLYRWKDGKTEALYPIEAEFAEPQWVFGMFIYDFVSPTKILCRYTQNGIWHLAWLDSDKKELVKTETPFTDIFDVRCGKDFAIFFGGSPIQPMTLVRMDINTEEMEFIKQAFEVTTDTEYFSAGKPISFPTTGGKNARAIYYAPKNKDYVALEGETPPLLVISHGGPTGSATTTLKYGIQYWTSRGFAVLDVNYGGSTGYGREYRQRLNGNWGIVDVDDCCNGAKYLVEQKLADPNRLAIRGGSAGGYTTLACLAFRDVFKAGASHFGLSELEVFVKDTHKFESKYLFSLVGLYPERKDLYYERSPINHVQNINCPLILFQGDEDKIVPPSQSQMMFEAVRSRGIPVSYVLFEGEQHGFRKSDSIKRALEGELYFYSKIFKFELAEPAMPVEIENL